MSDTGIVDDALYQGRELPSPQPRSPALPPDTESPQRPLPKALHLSRYAYNGAHASSSSITSRASTARAHSSVPENAAIQPLPNKAIKTVSHRFIMFTDTALGKLMLCVSCKLAWTARKTVPQKMKHIQTCAKKKKLTDETVIFLIREELQRNPVQDSRRKGGPVVMSLPEPQTLLENIVQDDAARKKGRRPKVTESVKEPTETRSDILERARLLLQSSGSKILAAQPMHCPKSPPRTQAFGESALALKFRSNVPPVPTPDCATVSSPDPRSPPRIQPFGKSSLADQFQVKATYVEPETSPIYASSPLAQRNRPSDIIELSPTPRSLELPDDLTLSPLASRSITAYNPVRCCPVA